MKVCGIKFSSELIAQLKKTIATQPDLSRQKLTRQVCEWLNWRSPNGTLKAMNCRKALLQLHRQGLIELPEAKQHPNLRKSSSSVAVEAFPEPSPLECLLAELGPISVVRIKRGDRAQSRQWNEMMKVLLLKDARAFGRSLLKITLLSLVVITLFAFLNEGSWFIYIVMAAGQISFVIGYYLMSEKMRWGESLICSLPVTRTMIIRGKCLAALLIAIGGMALWFLYACLLNFIFTDLPGNFHLFTNPIVIFFIIFYFSFFISFFFPIVTIFDKIWADKPVDLVRCHLYRTL